MNVILQTERDFALEKLREAIIQQDCFKNVSE
jgi:hypothetical protein